MDANQAKQPHGNFVAFLNRYKSPGDTKPTFEGRLAIPDADTQHRFALWAHEYTNPKTGEVQIMFNGQADVVTPTDDAMSQVASLIRPDSTQDVAPLNNLELQPRQLVLFPNGFKADAPDKQRPDYWGAFNPGNGQAIVRISAWSRKDRFEHAMLSGATSYPLPIRSEAEQQVAQAELLQLVESGALSKGMPEKKGKAKGRA